MGRMQRNKGASFEREIAKLLSVWQGREVKRHLGQARDGGEDIIAAPFTVECKRRKSLKTLYDWFAQVRRATKRSNAPIPLLVMRQDGDLEPLAVLRLVDLLALVEPQAVPYPGNEVNKALGYTDITSSGDRDA